MDSTLDTQLAAIVARHRGEASRMLQILWQVQELCDWISPEVIDILARELKVPPARVEEVADFYSFLYTSP
ncbi:MAG TPA: NAD(P)H-dependent oxidoreductase subunit E, partial [Rhodocyclaceae bacterium]|nr:NAD(P)H-dependent oxidoreductase subunit E [Rhodocyclaceae bacterium]